MRSHFVKVDDDHKILVKIGHFANQNAPSPLTKHLQCLAQEFAHRVWNKQKKTWVPSDKATLEAIQEYRAKHEQLRLDGN
jgi:hypothetical protein